MNKTMIRPAGLLLLGVMGAGPSVALAAGADNTTEQADAQSLLAAKVSIAEAIRSAEAKAGGRASSASFEGGPGATPFYHVEVLTADGSQQDLAVDATSGNVTKFIAVDGNEQDAHDQGQGADDGDGDSD